MTCEFLNLHIPRRMAEMRFKDFRIRHETTLVAAGETRTFRLWNTWAYFPSDWISPTNNMTIESNFGVLQTVSNDFNQVQYEHTGKITLSNHGPQTIRVSMILATPNIQ
jgi:hypothetical protein